jgi:hypothetical protein
MAGQAEPGTMVIEETHGLPLPGWDRRSIWGLATSETAYCLFAWLWPNTDHGDGGPRHRLAQVQDLDARALARKIATVTRHHEDDVYIAIGASLSGAPAAGETEQSWIPGPGDIRGGFCLVNPLGDRHLSFDDEDGRWYRLWRGRPPEPVAASEAIRLRPSDIDQIIGCTLAWITGHHEDPRCLALGDEIAAGAKAVVMYFGQAAGALGQPPPSPAEQDLAALYAKHADELAATEEAYKARPPGFPR